VLAWQTLSLVLYFKSWEAIPNKRNDKLFPPHSTAVIPLVVQGQRR
jgi:hypothetical protein